MTSVDVARPTRAVSVSLLLLLVGLLAWGLLAGSTIPSDTFTDNPEETDRALYEAVAHRVADGDDFYATTIQEQADRGFPTTPSATVRLPTMAHLQATLGDTGSRILLAVLLVAATALMVRQIERITSHRVEWYLGSLAFLTAIIVPFIGSMVWFHESWALALMLISLGLVDRDRWWPSVAVGVLAPFVRELALLYVGVRFLIAFFTNRREAVAWAAGGVAFVGFYLWHVSQVNAAQIADPPPSPGWLDAAGWPFIIDSVRTSTILYALPHWFTALVVPFALLGWVFARGYPARVIGAVVLAFVVVFCVIGQAGNIYWGLLYSAPLLVGLAFVPRGARTLARSLRA